MNPKIIGILALVVIAILSLTTITPTGQTQIKIESLPINTEPILDETCLINCEIDIEDQDFDPSILSIQQTLELPESNDSILQQIIDEAEIIPNQKVVISRHIMSDIFPFSESTVDISELELTESLSFITIEDEFDDISNHKLSWIFNTENIEFGSLIYEILINNKIQSEHTIEFTTNTIQTEPIIISELLSSSADGEAIVELKIKKLFVKTDKPYYLPEPTTINTLTFDNQPNKILVLQETGESVKIYPEDDKIQIWLSASDISYRKGQCQSSTGGSCYRYSYALATASPRPAIGEITVLDSIGNQIAQTTAIEENGSKTWINYRESLPSTKALELDLQRNSHYTVKIGSPNNIEFIIDTPKSQQNFVYSCTIYSCNFP